MRKFNTSNITRFCAVLSACVYGLALLYSGMVQARVTGNWNTTALTRIDVTAIDAPGLTPTHVVEIADGGYRFKTTGGFVAGEIKGSWQEIDNQYTVTVYRAYLEEQFRLKLEKIPGMIVNDIDLVKSSFQGSELDQGIWGNESYIYNIDTTKNGRRETVKVSMTVRVAGYPQLTQQVMALAKPMIAEREPQTSMDAAVTAVGRYWEGLEQATNTNSTLDGQ